MNFKKCLFVFFMVIISFLYVSICPFNSSLFAEEKVLKIGVSPNYPPIIFKEGDELTGLEVDLATALGKELEVEIDFVEIPWKDIIPALEDGRVDIIMNGMSIEESRSDRISFSDSYLQLGQMTLVRSEDLEKYKSAATLKLTTKTVGFEKETTGEYLVNEVFIQAKKRGFDAPEDAIEALRNKAIDVFIHDATEIWWLSEEYEEVSSPGLLLSVEYLAWGVRKDDEELLKKINAVLDSWKSDGRLKEKLELWLPYLVKTVEIEEAKLTSSRKHHKKKRLRKRKGRFRNSLHNKGKTVRSKFRSRRNRYRGNMYN